jgi:peptidoglycan/LPS O-acetylase OafA/YrhL
MFVTGMTLVLYPVLIGHNKFLRNILALDLFTPLARMTFAAYLLHPVFQNYRAFNHERGIWMSINENILDYVAFYFIAYIMGTIFTLLVETPFINLEKAFLTGGGGGPRKKR